MTRRTRLIAAVGCLALLAGVLGGEYVTKRYRLGIDTADVKCLPWTYYAISLGTPNPEVGELVAFKVLGLEPHYVDGMIFTKIVKGVPGDQVTARGDGLEVNGELYPFSKRTLTKLDLPAEAFNRSYQLADGEYFLAATEPDAFDSRYYGPVSAEQFIGSSRPIW